MDVQSPAAVATQNNTKPASSQPSQTPIDQLNKLPARKKLLLGGGLLILIALVGFLIFQSQKSQDQTVADKKTGSNFTPADKPANAIAKVGEEYIFQEDLAIEMANYPGEEDEKTRKMLVEKLVKDSIVLQAASKEKILALNPAVYNSPLKDYGKRISDIKAIEKQINSRTSHISGSVVTVWFHNYIPAKIGLEQGKQEALKRISALQKRVVAKEITMKQAGDIIKSDPSYANLDLGYMNNAYNVFYDKKNEHITVDETFNKMIWQLNPGEVSEVFLASAVNDLTSQEIEAFYAFAQVDEKVDSGNAEDFSKWAEARRSDYEIIYF